MGRRKKNTFSKSKMLASRIEESDYWQFETVLNNQHKTLQDAINAFVVACISGNLVFDGSKIVASGSI